MAGRNRRRGCVSGKFPRSPGCLRARPILDGAWLCDDHDVSYSKNMEIIQGKRIVLLPFQFEVVGKNSKSGMGIRGLRGRLGWLECAQRMDPLSRISGQSRLPENPNPGRTRACAEGPRPVAHPD